MRVLIATFTFPPNKDGISEASAALATGFSDAGWDVEVATSQENSARDTLEWSGIRIHEFACHGTGLRMHRSDEDVIAFQTFITEGCWDLVVFQSYFWPLYLSLDVFDRISGRKILVSHGYAALQWIKSPRFPWGLATLSRSVYQALRMAIWIRKLDRVVYLSERADFRGFFDHWVAKAVGYRGRRVIPNGVDLAVHGEKPAEFRQVHGIAPGQILFLCVANYCPRKDQGYAARAFRLARLKNAVLVFIGSEFNEHSRKFQENDLRLPENDRIGRILWLAQLDRQHTLDAFAACDAFVLSANHEAQPISLLEAMREEKPWVARDAGCIADMEGGICVRSECEMAEIMREYATNPGLRQHLGSEGRAAVERVYNLQSYRAAYLALAGELLNEK